MNRIAAMGLPLKRAGQRIWFSSTVNIMWSGHQDLKLYVWLEHCYFTWYLYRKKLSLGLGCFFNGMFYYLWGKLMVRCENLWATR